MEVVKESDLLVATTTRRRPEPDLGWTVDAGVHHEAAEADVTRSSYTVLRRCLHCIKFTHLRGGDGRGLEKRCCEAAEWLRTFIIDIKRYSIRERVSSAPYNLMIKESSTILASFERATSEATG